MKLYPGWRDQNETLRNPENHLIHETNKRHTCEKATRLRVCLRAWHRCKHKAIIKKRLMRASPSRPVIQKCYKKVTIAPALEHRQMTMDYENKSCLVLENEGNNTTIPCTRAYFVTKQKKIPPVRRCGVHFCTHGPKICMAESKAP